MNDKQRTVKPLKKERKDARMEIRLSQKQKDLFKKRAKACNIPTSSYVLLSALDRKTGAKSDKLLVYSVITLAMEIVRHVQDQYANNADDYLNERIDELCEKLS